MAFAYDCTGVVALNLFTSSLTQVFYGFFAPGKPIYALCQRPRIRAWDAPGMLARALAM